MKYHQRDIVEIDFPIPGEGYKVHPAVIVSNDELQIDEGFEGARTLACVYIALSTFYPTLPTLLTPTAKKV